ncbi:MAG: type II toxin-antitoxin system PemK/MazF family toxin [Candidatus Buchananbacteria bacterium]
MEKNLNDFIEWTKIKIRLHLSQAKEKLYFKEREMWWASLGMNIGYETDGKNDKFERPILIIKVFNRDVMWMLPLTSKEKTGQFYHQFKFGDANSTVILSQLRLISKKRLLRKIGMMSEKDFIEIVNRIKGFI